MTPGRRRLALACAGTAASVLLAGAGGVALAGSAAPTATPTPRTVDLPPAERGFAPVQASPVLPAVPAKDIPWTVADPAFDYDPTTGRPGAAFTPLVGADGQPRTRVLTGIDRGASYRIEVPLQGWNGDVVFWEHGYRGVGTTLWVDNPGFGLRETYIDAGYAWAASSYSANRYDIRSAMISTERLATRFDRLVAPADDRYLQGLSMGGHIIAGLLERKEVRWDGAAPMCGVMGDVAQFDIPLSYNLVAQALAEVDAFPFSAPAEYAAAIPRIKQALGLPVSPTGPNPTLTERGEVLRNVAIDLTGGPRPGAENAFTYWEGQTFTLGGFAADPTGTLGGVTRGRIATNAGVLYPTTFTFPDGRTLNERVERVAAAPGARRDHWTNSVTRLRGTFEVPVVSIHTLGDLFVPFEHQRIYAAKAHRQGTGGLLVQRTVRSAGHCEFSPAEAAQTFTDMVAWAQSLEGSGPVRRPAGEDVLNRTAVASPTFGCRFTSTGTGGTRGLFAPCPAPAPAA